MGEATTQKSTRRMRILDAAQDLFAAHGYDGVSMRDVAQEAEVALSLVTYHFGTKERLYRELFERRGQVLDERLAQLRDIEPGAENELELIVAAFVEPQMRLRETPSGLSFAQLLAREATDPSSEDRGIIEEFYDPMAREFIHALGRALPDVPTEELGWAYLYAVGALSMSALDVRVARFGDDGAASLAQKAEYLQRFICQGLRGLQA